jgi:hypothetical protein
MSLEEPVAQPVEHLTFNQGVPGSNPGGLTNKTKELIVTPYNSETQKVAH